MTVGDLCKRTQHDIWHIIDSQNMFEDFCLFVLVGDRGLEDMKFKQALKEKITLLKRFILYSLIKQVPFAKG